MSKKLKRTLQEKNRASNDEWELPYFVVSVNDKIQCLLCDVVISTLMKYNAHQHYKSHKDNKYAKLEGESRITALIKLKEGMQRQKQCFQNIIHQGKVEIEASKKVAYLLGKRGKLFSDAELVKDCVIEVVRCLDPKKVNKYKEAVAYLGYDSHGLCHGRRLDRGAKRAKSFNLNLKMYQ